MRETQLKFQVPGFSQLQLKELQGLFLFFWKVRYLFLSVILSHTCVCKSYFLIKTRINWKKFNFSAYLLIFNIWYNIKSVNVKWTEKLQAKKKTRRTNVNCNTGWRTVVWAVLTASSVLLWVSSAPDTALIWEVKQRMECLPPPSLLSSVFSLSLLFPLPVFLSLLSSSSPPFFYPPFTSAFQTK